MGCGRADDRGHDRSLFVLVELENGLPVANWGDEDVAAAALLVGDEQRGDVGAIPPGVVPDRTYFPLHTSFTK